MWRSCAVGAVLLSLASPSFADAPVTVIANLAFHSSFWVNLHHTVYAAAGAQSAQTRTGRPIGPLPSPLAAPLSEEERAAWDAAVAFYDRELADRDLRAGAGMTAIKQALAEDDLSAAAIGPELRAVLERAAPVYRRHFWPAHDRANRDWIRATHDLLRTIERDVIASHQHLYARPCSHRRSGSILCG
jgi:hypothetical protein